MKNNFIKSLMNSLNSRKRKRERERSLRGFFMKKESNGIGENKNSKKINKNNKIISSILAVIMCCQSFVGANPNSDNREFVSDKGIDNSPTADGSEEEEDEEDEEKKEEKKEDIKIKENNSSSLIRNSLGALLVAAMGGWWFYVTKNKDLKSKNEEIERLKKEFKEIYDKSVTESKDKDLKSKNEEIERLKKKLEEKDKELEKICKPDTESDAEVKEEEYLGTRYITFNVGERVERYGRTFFRNLTGLASSIAMNICFTDDNNRRLDYGLVCIVVQLSESKQNYNDYEQLSNYSKCILKIIKNGFVYSLTAPQLKRYLDKLLIDDREKVGPNFRFTNIFLFFSDKEKGDLGFFVPQELLSGGFLDIVK
ncbi:MAG: hypothetical protein CfP315_0924 [Candidatus Improbicoccus pseudotrichonymphae]|uniref:Uncharacterized protein n=1 Tax=Candidatus Improbicoccus pseudotrichonymphae TaxID=3033792 RepID=A0AA48I570_9FIRM|nr:MAG: hypothetical protein CfP315_0924 [Candidatus Improbicoccus pseudotrichonymphae]